ncbi:sulfatase-like hydrolase/transferase [Opitutus terrae]|uniref:Sulfatase n=1 Tax=Opitutus terrae (strain DSM 11246 / JCM 15787 / PB90-1) TaxID=452637 RepID=B1ZMD1_OPITP|nr:sulfatase-like hydrolase/transferase [Opitutus terrae]ACB73384.1 sulfatase [Opitutus terrae PB90-1]
MAPKPSILWIVTTQWRAQACGFAGDPNARTPCLDALAAKSVVWTQAVAPHPFGPFARAAMLTGVPSPENGVRDYFDPLPIWRSGATNGRTIAHTLDPLGYATAFFGKWHLGRRDPAEPLVGEAHARTIVPADARGGFAHWEGFESGFLLNDPWLHGTRIGEPRQFRGYQSDVLGERAARWVATQSVAPWFCVVSLEPPHPPYDAPAAGVPPPAPQEIVLERNVPRDGELEAKARRELAGYYAHIEATDQAIGRLVAAVDAAEATQGRPAPIVVFTSVHGDMHGAHGLFRKGWPYEESVRVPLLVRAGGAIGGRSDELVSLLDLPRWAEAWARGAEVRRTMAGHEAQAISMPSVVRLPQQCDRIWHGVRTRTRKLVLNDDGTPWLLFDLENDPGEQRNLVGDPAWRVERDRLRALMRL